MRFANIPIYLSNSVAAVGKFGSEFSNYVEQGLKQGRVQLDRVLFMVV